MKKQNSLIETQKKIQEAVCNKTFPVELLDWIIEKPPMSIHERIKIYQDAYFIRLSESLKDDFPSVEKIVGNEEFNEMINEFINTNPSRTQNLAEYSIGFPDFVKLKNQQAYEAALRDWMEILSFQIAEPLSEITLAEIQLGKPFFLKIHPATLMSKIETKHLLAFKKSEQIFFHEINEEYKSLLEFLTLAQSMDDLANYAEKVGINPNNLSNIISEWIKDRIIFCERIKND